MTRIGLLYAIATILIEKLYELWTLKHKLSCYDFYKKLAIIKIEINFIILKFKIILHYHLLLQRINLLS